MGRSGTPPTPVVHTVVVGGMPGWQIALIAVAIAIVAAAVALILYRARATRRHQSAPSA
jgi:biopolymer transport protein ExbB/TolQ